MAMANSNMILVVVFVMIARLVFASHASQIVSPMFISSLESVSPTFTFQNYLPVEDFMSYNCDCVDVGGTVTTITGTVANCVDTEIQASTCPTGLAPTVIFCKFLLYTRNRKVSPATITASYANVQVWQSSSPPKTYFQLTESAIYGSITDQYFDTTFSNSTAACK